LILFLCICLVWVGAAYLETGPDIVRFGLFWTAVVLIAAITIIIGARIFGWVRLWRAKAAARPVPAPKPAKPAPIIHEDDAGLAALIAEANSALAKAPGYTGPRRRTPLSGMPLYLLIGPQGAGKTTTFMNSGLEPHLLAGEATGSVPGSTPLCNIWLAKGAIFAEIAGRAFAGDSGRWNQLLRGLQGRSSVRMWRRLWRDPDEGLELRGVVAFCDVRELTGGSADPQRLEKSCRAWQERLRAIGEIFGVQYPVYQVFTKCDQITFFPDFFGRLPDSEINQVLGCTLPFRRPDPTRANEVYGEVEAKRLTSAFRPLYYSLAERRISHLAHEPNPARKPAIYEFPRELKRIREPLVQFLTDVFRPHPLQPVPLLRGFYLTATQETETAAAIPASGTSSESTGAFAAEATGLFRGDATRMFNQEDTSKPGLAVARAKGTRWLFTADVFHQVVLGDTARHAPAPKDPHLERYRRLLFVGICAAFVLWSIALLISWVRNHNLLQSVALAASAEPGKHGTIATHADLGSLEHMRAQLVELENGKAISYHWGLYKGGAILDAARAAYFGRFQQLLLNDLNEAMVAQLRNLPPTPNPNDPDEPTYDLLKAHLTISKGNCKPEPEFIARVLRGVRSQFAPEADAEWATLADRQIAFYASTLERSNPCRIQEDQAARDRARQYLNGIKSVDRIYRRIVADAENNVAKGPRLGDLAPKYRQVLNGKDETSAAFTLKGWSFVQEAAKKEGKTGAGGETCVTGGGSFGQGLKQNEVERSINQRFFTDYIQQWKQYIAGFRVVPYGSAVEASQKLGILADHDSPLLALLALAANQTDFSINTGSSLAEKLPFVADLKKQEKAAEQKRAAIQKDSSKVSTDDITRTFQPVHWVVAPNSDKWVSEKNKPYIDALAQLGNSMRDIAANKTDPAIYQSASQNRAKAMEAAKQLAAGFTPMGVGGVDGEVQRLLEEPITLADRFLKDPSKLGTDQINNELRTLCSRIGSTLHKYPFKPAAQDEATLQELSVAFAPGGLISRFAGASLGELVAKDGSQWKVKDPSKKPPVTEEMLNFLISAQKISDALFPNGATQPRLSFSLRPNLSNAFAGSNFELEVGKTQYLWTDAFQKIVTWPPPGSDGEATSATARIRGTFSYAFAKYEGIWGLFRVFADAEPRKEGSKLVEWKYSRVGRSRDKIDPDPVRVEVFNFSGGWDVFIPGVFSGIQCPARAVM
jgi:type VI secretion system protein ImpL